MFKCIRSLAGGIITMTAAGSLLGALGLLSACGQKGPLTLPKPVSSAASAAPSASSPSTTQ
ncbi:MAG: hypothetical protein E6H58_18595 [Betaproteobacteria bacterium]|nr:MAG: hypothetical protein E6H58_18595 [Betaproteobacteria bacterium]